MFRFSEFKRSLDSNQKIVSPTKIVSPIFKTIDVQIERMAVETMIESTINIRIKIGSILF